MKSTHWMTSALVVGVMGTIGCAGTTPVAPATTPVAEADRQVLAVDDLASLEAAFAQMPARIAEADAARLLVEIDESQIKADEGTGYAVAQAGSVRWRRDKDNDNNRNRWRDRDNNNRWRSQARDRDRDQDRDRDRWRDRDRDRDGDRYRDRDRYRSSGWGRGDYRSRYDRYRYYRSGDYYLPYYYASGYYYPYANVYDPALVATTSALYSPYLYGAAGAYSPYSYYGGMGGYGQMAAAQNVVVNIRNMQYIPSTIPVAVNGTVTFVNQDAVPHTATSTTGGWDSGNIAVGQSSQPMVFATPGSYSFYCRYHPQMTGTIIVQ